MTNPTHVLLSLLLVTSVIAQVPEEAVKITGNAGLQRMDDGVLQAGGPDYRAHFTVDGMRYEPALGETVAVTQHLSLRPVSVRRGDRDVVALPSLAEPIRREMAVLYPHASDVRECFDVDPEHVALSWQFDQRPPGRGDLVVRYELDSSLPAPTAIEGGGLQLVLPEVGGVTIGAVTGVDALGTRVAGNMHFAEGILQLSLPAAFVDEAAYPMVLDPAVGTTIAVMANNSTDYDPDVAYDDTWHVYLAVWSRAFSSQDRDVRGQFVSQVSGAPVGSLLLFGASDYGRDPRVACLGSRDRFGVTWTERDVIGDVSRLRFRLVDAINFTLVSNFLTTLAGFSSIQNADVGADVTNGDAFVVVYQDNHASRIAARRFSFDPVSGQLQIHNPDTVVSNTAGISAKTYSSPSISRGSSPGGFLVAARRHHSTGPTVSIWTTLLSHDASTTGPSLVLDNSAFHDVTIPHVDGYGDRWLVAWQKLETGSSYNGVTCQHLSLASGGASLAAGASTSFGGTTLTQAIAPTVAYTPGRSWVCYQSTSGGVRTLRTQSLNGSDCAICAGVHINPVGTFDRHISMATGLSSGCGYCEMAMAVWEEGNDIYGLRHDTFSDAGAIGDLGGGCGDGGLQSFNHNPSLGSNSFTCTIAQLPPTALLSVFNFAAAPTTTLQCGSCFWVPFETTVTLPVPNGNASVSFPIPCANSLVGAVFETQWTTLDFGQGPCSLVTGLALSGRSLLTIGN